jgi:hypothetical protein
MPDWIGYRWLIDRYGLEVTQRLRVETAVGPTRTIVTTGGEIAEDVVRAVREEFPWGAANEPSRD